MSSGKTVTPRPAGCLPVSARLACQTAPTDCCRIPWTSGMGWLSPALHSVPIWSASKDRNPIPSSSHPRLEGQPTVSSPHAVSTLPFAESVPEFLLQRGGHPAQCGTGSVFNDLAHVMLAKQCTVQAIAKHG